MANPYAEFAQKPANPYARFVPELTNTPSRLVGLTAMGINDNLVANTIGAPVDAVAWGARQLGLRSDNPIGGSESIKKGIDYVATLPGRVRDVVSQVSLDPLTDSRTSRFAPETGLEKTAYGVGEGVGNALSVALPAGAIAQATRGATTLGPRVANVLAQQPVAQTVMGAVGGGVTGATDSPTAGLAASLAVPGVNMLARRAITPIQTRLSPQEASIVAAANREGVPLTPAQRTGSPSLRMVEETMAKTPGAAGPMQDTLSGQRAQFNRAAMERTGQTATDASPDTIDRAYTVLGQTFDDLVSRTTLAPDVQFARDIRATANDYGSRLSTDQAPVFASYIRDIAPLIEAVRTQGANPQISGEVYQNIRSNLARRIRQAHAQPELQEALGGIATALDDVMERSASGALRGEWQEARRQYQALKTIDGAMSGGTQVDRSAADIPFGALKGAVKKADPEGYSRGRGQLNELSRVGDYIAARVPNSGTATRSAIMNPLMWPVMAAGRVASGAYNTPGVQNYLSQGLGGVQVNPANVRALLSSLAAQNAIDQTPGPNNALRPGAGR